MTHEADQSTFVPTWESQFVPLRNEWLNCFAQLELEICRSLSRLSRERFSKGKCISQRVTELASLKPSSICSTAASKKLKELAGEFEGLASIRASIVHASMIPGDREGAPAALFHNVFEAARDVPNYLTMTSEDFDRTRKAVFHLTQQLRTLS